MEEEKVDRGMSTNWMSRSYLEDALKVACSVVGGKNNVTLAIAARRKDGTLKPRTSRAYLGYRKNEKFGVGTIPKNPLVSKVGNVVYLLIGVLVKENKVLIKRENLSREWDQEEGINDMFTMKNEDGFLAIELKNGEWGDKKTFSQTIEGKVKWRI